MAERLPITIAMPIVDRAIFLLSIVYGDFGGSWCGLSVEEFTWSLNPLDCA